MLAQRPNYILTNSKTTQARIKKFYKRDSTIIYPFFDSTPPKEQIDSTCQKKGITILQYHAQENTKFRVNCKNIYRITKNIVIVGSGSLSNELKNIKIANM